MEHARTDGRERQASGRGQDMTAMEGVTEGNLRRQDHLILLLLCSLLSILWGSVGLSSDGLVDFRAVYYDARCLIEHHDPYNPHELLSVYQAEDGQFPSDPARTRIFIGGSLVCFNLPSTLLILAPLALLRWGLARVLWIVLTAVLFTLAAVLAWDQARRYAPRLALLLACLLVANTELLYMLGNAAGIVVALSVIGAWSLLNERQMPWGTAALAVALAIKPHDAGLVWLYLVLLGGVQRRRALQAAALTAALALPALLWVGHVAPHWMAELHANLLAGSAPGGVNAPGPAAGGGRDADMVIDLQSALYIFTHRPSVYNAISYLLCAGLLAVWAVRLRAGRASPWIGLAVSVAPTVLVTYHRGYDAKLLLLTLPACAMLWARGGATKWLAALLTTAGILATADLPLNYYLILTGQAPTGLSGMWGKALALAVLEPTPVVLLAMGVFYSWAYLKDRQPASC